MAFMDKLTELAKKGEELAKETAGKANEFIDAKKTEVEVSKKQKEIEGVKAQIGDFYWKKYTAGEVLDIEPNELCGKIQQLLNDIELLSAPDSEPAPSSAQPAAFCQNCGTKLEDGAKFCPSCGMKA